jgi:hypothetical protein
MIGLLKKVAEKYVNLFVIVGFVSSSHKVGSQP